MDFTPDINPLLTTRSPFIGMNSLPENDIFLIKIDEDYKIITGCFLDQKNLEKVIRTYYPDSLVEISGLRTNTPSLIGLITQPNSFLKTNEIVPEELQLKLSQLDDVFNYFNKYSGKHLSDLINKNISASKTTTLEESSYKHEEYLNLPEAKIGHSTRIPVINSKLYNLRGGNILGEYKDKSLMPDIPEDNIFDISGKYINSNETIEIIKGYEDYTKSTSLMELVNFNKLLLETEIQPFNIYFNNQFNNILVVNKKDDFIFHNNKINNLFSELNLLFSVNLENDKLENIKELNKDIFVNIEDAKSRINRLLNDKIIDSKLTIDEIKNLIKKYFSINSNPQNCIKFTNIWNTISSEIKVSEQYVNYIKRQLPNILFDLGLQKKRLADGIYWYGLVVRNTNETESKPPSVIDTKISDEPLSCEEIQNRIKQRSINFFENEMGLFMKPMHGLDQIQLFDPNTETGFVEDIDELVLKPMLESDLAQPPTPTTDFLVVDKSDKNNTAKLLQSSGEIKPTKTLKSKVLTNKKSETKTSKAQPPSDEISKVIKKKTNKK
jgi:hypothetical protein